MAAQPPLDAPPRELTPAEKALLNTFRQVGSYSRHLIIAVAESQLPEVKVRTLKLVGGTDTAPITGGKRGHA